jgi:thiol-disulfide isomerase/thioredoxin
MGKQSQRKKQRRIETAPPTPRRSIPVFWIAMAIVIVGAFAALSLLGSDNEVTSEDRAKPVTAAVITTGEKLAKVPPAGEKDLAVGDRAPKLAGTSLDGEPMTIAPGSSPMVLMVLAHWCPHCQAEVPSIVDWYDSASPDGVELYGISTSASEDRPNFPPAAWLRREEWPFVTLVDDEVGSAGQALGMDGFPLLVFIDADGKVVDRYTGEMPIDEFEAAVKALR